MFLSSWAFAPIESNVSMKVSMPVSNNIVGYLIAVCFSQRLLNWSAQGMAIQCRYIVVQVVDQYKRDRYVRRQCHVAFDGHLPQLMCYRCQVLSVRRTKLYYALLFLDLWWLSGQWLTCAHMCIQKGVLHNFIGVNVVQFFILLLSAANQNHQRLQMYAAPSPRRQ